MGNYDRVHPRKPQGIENRHAYIVGGGIAGLDEWFSKDFFESNLWYYWSAMLAFQPYQSLIEMRRYAIRFMHQLHLIKSLKQILRTKYDQYHSLILPLQKYLLDNGVQFVANTTVTDMDMNIQGKLKTITALRLSFDGIEKVHTVAKDDLVFFTNGSMTQNSTRGSMTEAPVMNTDTENRGCFTLWEKLAAKCDDFGHIVCVSGKKWLLFGKNTDMTILIEKEYFYGSCKGTQIQQCAESLDSHNNFPASH